MAQGSFPLLDPRPPLGEVCRTPLIAERHDAELRFASNSSAAAKQAIAAEGHLNKIEIESAQTAAESALQAFRSSGLTTSDAVGCAECTRLIAKTQQLKAYFMDDEESRSLKPAEMLSQDRSTPFGESTARLPPNPEGTQELQNAKTSGDQVAQAILQLGLCEMLSFGTAATGGLSLRCGWLAARVDGPKATGAGGEGSLDWCAGSSPVFRPGIKLSNIDIPGTYTALFWREGGTFLESATFSRMLPCDSCVLSLQQHVARAIASGLRCFQLLGRAACFSFAFGLTPYTISQFESLNLG
eukprot:g19444.t1